MIRDEYSSLVNTNMMSITYIYITGLEFDFNLNATKQYFESTILFLTLFRQRNVFCDIFVKRKSILKIFNCTDDPSDV